MQSASLAIQKSGHRLASKESAIFAHNLKLTSMTTRLKIEAHRAATCNDWSRYDSLAEKVELQEHELVYWQCLYVMIKTKVILTIVPFLQSVQHRIKRMKKTIIN